MSIFSGYGNIVVGLIFIFFSLFLLVFFHALFYKSNQSRHWPNTQGVITASERDNDDSGDGNTAPIHIAYDYSVNNTTYTGNNISFALFKPANVDIEKYPVGKAVDVYYNPNQITESVLEINPTHRMDKRLIAGALIPMVMGLYFLFFAA